MAKITWTQEQLEAINHGNGKLLVSASAGAGKTAVLVERIIRKIANEKNNIDVDELLVVTFTNAAAAEMKDRIRDALLKRLENGTNTKHLERQLTLLNKASIGTIHSFCLEVIRQYFEQLKLDPNFRVANEIETAFLQKDVLEELFEKRYSDENPGFTHLVDCYGGGRSDYMLQDLVLKLYEFARSNPWPEDWLKSLPNNFLFEEDNSIDELIWAKNIKTEIKLELEFMLDSLDRALTLAKSPDGPEDYIENILTDIKLIKQLIICCDKSWDDLYKVFSNVEFKRLKPCRKDIDEDLKEEVQNIRNTIKRNINTMVENMFSRNSEELLKDLKELYPIICSLSDLVIEYGKAYTKAKQSKGLVDFDDLEHYCLKLLLDNESKRGDEKPSEIAIEISEKYVEVIVDEYQDINAVQEMILSLATSHNNLFMVGDVKQSIYRFRLARPELFIKKHKNYSTDKKSDERKIDLNLNFRSRKVIIDSINFIFRQIMSQQVGEIDYDKDAELYYGAYFPGEELLDEELPVELHLVDLKEKESFTKEADTEKEEIDKIKIEAQLVGEKIKEMVSGNRNNVDKPFLVYDKKIKDYRQITYKDIAVLMRTTSNWANVFLDVFHSLGIPSYTETDTGYFEVIEIRTFLSLLRIIDNPRQDIALAAVLRSPIVGLSAEDLGNIRLYHPKGSYFDALKKASTSKKSDLNIKINKFMANLEEWRSLARSSDLASLIWTLLKETGYYDFVGGMPGGRYRQANLRALFDRARQFETTTFRGLFNFLRYIDNIQESGNDLGTAKALGENENVVRIMSIHKSKGLEFPVVIVSGLGKNFNFQDLNKDILFDKDYGLGPTFVDSDKRIKYPTIAKFAVRNKLKLETLAEEMRILYVAMTRAKEKLILSGTVKDIKRNLANWSRNVNSLKWQLPIEQTANGKSYLDWLCPALIRHRSGEEMRKLGSCNELPPEHIRQDKSNWNIKMHKYDQFDTSLREIQKGEYEDLIEKVKNLTPLEPQSDFEYLINKNFRWEYPYLDIVGKPAKIAASEIGENVVKEPFYYNKDKGKQNIPVKRPEFLQKSSKLTPTEKGSAFHKVMQHLDIKEDLNENDIKLQLKDMVEKEHITEEQIQFINIQWIVDFVKSDLAKRIIGGINIKREVPFTIALPLDRIYAETRQDVAIHESMLVQGIIDMLVEEDDGYIVVDFKTDKVIGNIQTLINRYKNQINLYTEAVEMITRKPVKERFLYLFDISKEIVI